jgi:hypothetical protein
MLLGHWPPGVPSDDSLHSWVRILARHGYEPCEDSAHEAAWEKVAI